jgi:hypothetical protein
MFCFVFKKTGDKKFPQNIYFSISPIKKYLHFQRFKAVRAKTFLENQA